MRIRDQLLALALAIAPACVHSNAVKVSHDVNMSQDYVFAVEPSVISSGESAILFWKIPGATKVSLSEAPTVSGALQDIGVFGAAGQLEVRPARDTTYVIICEGTTTISCASASLQVRLKH